MLRYCLNNPYFSLNKILFCECPKFFKKSSDDRFYFNTWKKSQYFKPTNQGKSYLLFPGRSEVSSVRLQVVVELAGILHWRVIYRSPVSWQDKVIQRHRYYNIQVVTIYNSVFFKCNFIQKGGCLLVFHFNFLLVLVLEEMEFSEMIFGCITPQMWNLQSIGIPGTTLSANDWHIQL